MSSTSWQERNTNYLWPPSRIEILHSYVFRRRADNSRLVFTSLPGYLPQCEALEPLQCTALKGFRLVWVLGQHLRDIKDA